MGRLSLYDISEFSRRGTESVTKRKWWVETIVGILVLSLLASIMADLNWHSFHDGVHMVLGMFIWGRFSSKYDPVPRQSAT